jgi:hypothetical protein
MPANSFPALALEAGMASEASAPTMIKALTRFIG